MTKITCDASELRAALLFASMAIERRNTIPILSYCLFEAEDGKMRVSGTNLDQVASKAISVEHAGNVSMVLPPRPLLALLRGARGQVTVEKDEDVIRFDADGITLSIRSFLPVEDWPHMPVPSSFLGQHKLTVALLAKVLKSVAPCISTEETRYYLNGAFLHNLNDKLIVVAIDGHRLARYDPDVAWTIPSMILPRDAFSMLRQALTKNQNGGVECTGFTRIQPAAPEIAQETQIIRFEGDDWSITSKVIDGTFPDYTRVIPSKEPAVSVTLTGTALGRIYGTERSRAIAFSTDRQTMIHNDPDGIEFSALCLVNLLTERPHFKFGINHAYLQAFTAIHETIRLEGSGSGDPLRVITEDPALTWVIMPMRV